MSLYLWKSYESRGQINEKFCHCENSASEASFAIHCRQNFIKFNIAICINCIRKMLIWGHFRSIMELLLNNCLGYCDILSLRKLLFFFLKKVQQSQHPCYMLTSKYPDVRNATNWIGGDLNVSMNQSHQSSLQRVASRNLQSAVNIGPMGGCASVLGQINLQLMEELGCSKRLTGDCTITKYKIFIQIIVEIFELPPSKLPLFS